MIASFPDIGLKNARFLLITSARSEPVVNASNEELLEVKGIGGQRSKTIHELSNRQYR